MPAQIEPGDGWQVVAESSCGDGWQVVAECSRKARHQLITACQSTRWLIGLLAPRRRRACHQVITALLSTEQSMKAPGAAAASSSSAAAPRSGVFASYAMVRLLVAGRAARRPPGPSRACRGCQRGSPVSQSAALQACERRAHASKQRNLLVAGGKWTPAFVRRPKHLFSSVTGDLEGGNRARLSVLGRPCSSPGK